MKELVDYICREYYDSSDSDIKKINKRICLNDKSSIGYNGEIFDGLTIYKKIFFDNDELKQELVIKNTDKKEITVPIALMEERHFLDLYDEYSQNPLWFIEYQYIKKKIEYLLSLKNYMMFFNDKYYYNYLLDSFYEKKDNMNHKLKGKIRVK